MRYREGLDVGKLTKDVLALMDKVERSHEQVMAHCRRILFDGDAPTMKVKDRRDWKAIDMKFACILILQSQADNEYTHLMIQIGLEGFNAKNMDRMHHLSNYRQALECICLGHASFIMDGVYRDDNADWYCDRLFSHLETMVKHGARTLKKRLGERSAEIRGADRQATRQGSGDSKGGEGSKGSESGTPQAGNESAQSV